MANFRKSFSLTVHSAALNWYPKHMNSGMKQMQAKLRSVDCILEVHDARIPISGRNPNLCGQLVGNKPHILVLNKSDLIPDSNKHRIAEHIQNTSSISRVIFTNSKNDQDRGMKKLVPVMQELIGTSDRFNRSHLRENHAMIIGIPNVGKSSLINMLRSKHLKKGRAVKVGPSAGVTKCVHEKVKISESPLLFLFDTPGILQPRFTTISNGMKLAACGNLPDSQVGEINIADFILFTLNQSGNFKYVEFAGLSEPDDCIATVLSSISRRLNFITQYRSSETNQIERKPDLTVSASHFIQEFRKGNFGRVVFDNLEGLQVRRLETQHDRILPVMNINQVTSDMKLFTTQ